MAYSEISAERALSLRGIDSALRKRLLSKAVVKHDRAWSSQWMGDRFLRGFARRLWASFPEVKSPCRHCIPQKSFGSDNKLRSRVCTHAKRSHMHIKDPVVHVRVRWIIQTFKRPACTAAGFPKGKRAEVPTEKS